MPPRFEQRGYTLKGLKMMNVERSLAEKHYAVSAFLCALRCVCGNAGAGMRLFCDSDKVACTPAMPHTLGAWAWILHLRAAPLPRRT